MPQHEHWFKGTARCYLPVDFHDFLSNHATYFSCPSPGSPWNPWNSGMGPLRATYNRGIWEWERGKPREKTPLRVELKPVLPMIHLKFNFRVVPRGHESHGFSGKGIPAGKSSHFLPGSDMLIHSLYSLMHATYIYWTPLCCRPGAQRLSRHTCPQGAHSLRGRHVRQTRAGAHCAKSGRAAPGIRGPVPFPGGD